MSINRQNVSMMSIGKKGVLLVNLGILDDFFWGVVYCYFKQFLFDFCVIDYLWLFCNLLVCGIIVFFCSGSFFKLYKMLWMEEGFLFKFYGECVWDGVQELFGEEYIVEFVMCYQNLFIGYVIENLEKVLVFEIMVIFMFLQYVLVMIGFVYDVVMQEFFKWQIIFDVKMVNFYYDCFSMIKIFVDNVCQFDLNSYDYIIFSYYGLLQW